MSRDSGPPLYLTLVGILRTVAAPQQRIICAHAAPLKEAVWAARLRPRAPWSWRRGVHQAGTRVLRTASAGGGEERLLPGAPARRLPSDFPAYARIPLLTVRAGLRVEQAWDTDPGHSRSVVAVVAVDSSN